MKITALTENTSAVCGIGEEHGLSLFIETENKKILFDMGQTNLFAKNAEKLNIDLSKTDIAIISHGHYDHGGGLDTFLKINSISPVYISRYAFEPHYNSADKYIGLAPALINNERLITVEDICNVDLGITLYSCNNSAKAFDLGSFGMSTLSNGKKVPDDFRHEQYLLIEEKNKKVLFSGCSHKGILNIVKWFEPDVLIGGFHFSKLPPDEKLKEYAAYLNSYKTVFYTCHCTGNAQYSFMSKYMDRIFYLSAGQSITV